MHKMPEIVSNKFIELFVVLNNAADDLKMAGAEACLTGDFSRVTDINDSCRKLQALEAEIKSTLSNFSSGYKVRSVEKTRFNKQDRNRTRTPRIRLVVNMADKIIEEPTIAETFVKTLKAFGLERVAKLNKVVTSIPLMARTQVNGYQSQRRCDGWFITTHVNKISATTVLEEIAKSLTT
ncbi:MAG: hypothetical protein Q8S52_11335 [Methylobacter sp.]|nr:hypothetical protein [Methylobacter sp.]MDP2430350.1 hypothetical protein [Methylobacter sp.]MDP3053519.1 hypothetical protein [Methylobacter sp.]MDP3362698.1 hypothetical protein [Methylobacter sp.]